MKTIVIGIIAAIAAAMGYFWFQGECAGKIYANFAECRENFSGEFCAIAFTQANTKARNDYPPFPNQGACDRVFPRCMPHAVVVGGFVPVPRSVCTERSAGGPIGTPIYQKYGQTVTLK